MDMSLSLAYGVSGLHRLHETGQLVAGGSDVGGRASVPTVQGLNISSGTFCDKAGGRELACGLAVTSICIKSPFLLWCSGHKLAQASYKREEEEGGHLRAALKLLSKKMFWFTNNFLNSGTSPAFCFLL